MSTVSPDVDQFQTDPLDAYRKGYSDGREAQVEECAAQHHDRIADVLDVIDRHVGDSERLRIGILAALGHGGAA